MILEKNLTRQGKHSGNDEKIRIIDYTKSLGYKCFQSIKSLYEEVIILRDMIKSIIINFIFVNLRVNEFTEVPIILIMGLNDFQRDFKIASSIAPELVQCMASWFSQILSIFRERLYSLTTDDAILIAQP